MALTFPPDGWEPKDGVWGVDFDENTSVKLSGGRSLEFITGGLTNVAIEQSDHTPAVEGDDYLVDWVIRATANAAADAMRLRIVWYDSDKVQLSFSTIFSGTVDTINTWEKKAGVATAPANTRYFRLRLIKNNTNAWTGYCDSANAQSAVPRWNVANASPQTLTATSWNKLQYSASTQIFGVNFDNPNDEIDILIEGIYTINAKCLISNIDDDEPIEMAIAINGTRSKRGGKRFIYNPSPLLRDESIEFGITQQFLQGDTLSIEVFVGAAVVASTISTVGNSNENYFTGARVE